MTTATRKQRKYDHRLQDLVRTTGDIGHAVGKGVPRSTARGWLDPTYSQVFTIDVVDEDLLRLQQKVLDLQKRVQRLIALLRILVIVMKVSDFKLSGVRLPNGRNKFLLLRAIERSRTALPLRSILKVIRLSPSRYHCWKRNDECSFDDTPSCPKSSPHQLTKTEVETIQEMVTSDEFRHVPTGTLALLAQRLGKVFASASTWYRLVRLNKWRRPRKRVYPSKPTTGIRATTPNEIWHVDTSVIRLLDGSRAYLHAVIDNFSRRILSWKVSATFDTSTTAELLLVASKGLTDMKPKLLVDGGVENFNSDVDELVDSGILQRLLAMTEISFSNSLIESWWRSLKNQWLYLNTLDTVNSLQALIEFYVEEHNTKLPHSAFHGQTPNEMYFDTGKNVPKELEAARKEAREKRIEENRQASCKACDQLAAISKPADQQVA